MFYFCTITKLKNVKLCHRKSGTLYLKVLTLDKKGRIRTDSHKRPHTGSDTHRDLVMLVPSLSLFVPLKYLVFTSSLRHLLLNPSWQLLATLWSCYCTWGASSLLRVTWHGRGGTLVPSLKYFKYMKIFMLNYLRQERKH